MSDRPRPPSRLRIALRWAVLGLGTAGVALSVLSLLDTDEALIRIWDFPRIQIAAVLFGAALTFALAWQLYWIRPYTPMFSQEAEAVAECGADLTIRLLVANVLMGNEDAVPLLALVRRVEPDLLLLLETNDEWHRRLDPLRERYEYEVAQPQDDQYGMHLFSRLDLIDPEVRFLLEDYVPSIKTGVHLRSGARIDFYGVHPKPPPLADTGQRDAELLIVGSEVRDEPAPAIVAGDLNDVAWSRTIQLFQEVSGLLDPRVGRGPYATFNADWPPMRWPLDHVFFDESFWLLDVAVMGDIGSDHFPFFVAICHEEEAAAEQQEPRSDAPDEAEADEEIREGREQAPFRASSSQADSENQTAP